MTRSPEALSRSSRKDSQQKILSSSTRKMLDEFREFCAVHKQEFGKRPAIRSRNRRVREVAKEAEKAARRRKRTDNSQRDQRAFTIFDYSTLR